MDANEIKAFYESLQAFGKEKLDRVEYEARHASLETRVSKLELELDTRYEKLFKMIDDIRTTIATRDRSKLDIIFAATLSFIGGGGLIALLTATHVIH